MRHVALLLLAACFDPKPPTGVPCSNVEPCPAGQRCVGGLCDGEPEQPPGDATVSPTDGAIDGPGNSAAKCAAATPIGLTDSMVIGSLAGATDDFDLVGCGGSAGGGVEVVYVFAIPPGGASIMMSVASPDFTGKFFMTRTCPPVDFTACGSITSFSGATVGSSYSEGNAYLVIERGANQTGTTFVIRP